MTAPDGRAVPRTPAAGRHLAAGDRPAVPAVLRKQGYPGGRRVRKERAAPDPGLLEGDRAAADRGHAAAGRRAAAAGPDLRLPAARGGRGLRGWFAGAATDPGAGYTAAEYAEHVRTEYSTYRWLLEPLLEATGFEIVSVSFARRLYGAYTCVKRQ
jgi:hypothetical protein